MVANLKRRRLFGQPLVESLDRAGITCNRCEIPFDEVDATLTSGLRFGVSACTTRGLGVEQVLRVARWIVEVVDASEEELFNPGKSRSPDFGGGSRAYGSSATLRALMIRLLLFHDQSEQLRE